MRNYRIFETDEFNRQLQKFPHQRIAFIRKKLKEFVYPQLQEEPYFGKNIKKLKEEGLISDLKDARNIFEEIIAS